MGLKCGWMFSSARILRCVKIRPKWDWNPPQQQDELQVACVKIRPKWDWNSWRMWSLSPSFTLKSDQNGIEMEAQGRPPGYPEGLKSDQNGIEIHHHPLMRPWRHQLKSDQNGIEIPSCSGRYRSSIRLKSDQNGIEIHPSPGENWMRGCVKIRPKWDWNRHTPIHATHHKGVKIRPKWDWNPSSQPSCRPDRRVKIRPKWDWNWLFKARWNP